MEAEITLWVKFEEDLSEDKEEEIAVSIVDLIIDNLPVLEADVVDWTKK